MTTSRVTTTSGTTLYVCATNPATHDSSGYAALTWVAVSDVVDLGDFGPMVAEIKHTPLDTGVTKKFKGSTDYGKCSIKLGRDADDAGQALLKAASLVYTDYSFKVLFQDTSIQYFDGKVLGYTTNVGAIDKIVGSSVDVSISGTIVEVIAP